MTKLDIVHAILTDSRTRDFGDRLWKLYEEDRITSGCYHVYNPYEVYSLRTVSELIDKATKSKDYTRYLKRIDSIQYNVWWKMYNEEMDKIEAFLKEQEALPFEQSQKQQLIANGELSA